MDKIEFIRSSIIDEILKELLQRSNVDPNWVKETYKLPLWQAQILCEEHKKYNDEVFMHGCLYELSFEEEPPTIARIMAKFKVSYLLAKHIFVFYMENI